MTARLVAELPYSTPASRPLPYALFGVGLIGIWFAIEDHVWTNPGLLGISVAFIFGVWSLAAGIKLMNDRLAIIATSDAFELRGVFNDTQMLAPRASVSEIVSTRQRLLLMDSEGRELTEHKARHGLTNRSRSSGGRSAYPSAEPEHWTLTIQSSRLPFLASAVTSVVAGAVITFFAVRSAVAGRWDVAILALLLVGGGIVGAWRMSSANTRLTVDVTTVRLEPPFDQVIVVSRPDIARLVRATPGRSIPLDARDRSGRLLLRIQAPFSDRDLAELARYLGLSIDERP